MLLYVDFKSEIPIYQQLRNQIVIGIANGELSMGERLPTIRSLSNDLGVNMMTVSKAYQQLKTEGYICGDRRNGAVVCTPKPEGLIATRISQLSKESLRLIASEAKLSGVSKDAFLKLCSDIFEDSGEV